MTGRDGSLLSVKGSLTGVRFLLAVICLLSIISCGHKRVKSLCVLDFEANMCWTNREKNEGFEFYEMWTNQKHAKDFPQIDLPIWFAIMSNDLERIVNEL